MEPLVVGGFDFGSPILHVAERPHAHCVIDKEGGGCLRVGPIPGVSKGFGLTKQSCSSFDGIGIPPRIDLARAQMSTWWIDAVGEPKLTRLGGLEKRAGLFDIGLCDEDLDCAQTVEGEPMRLPQRFTPHSRRDAGGLQERADLLRVDFTVRDEYAVGLLIHRALRC